MSDFYGKAPGVFGGGGGGSSGVDVEDEGTPVVAAATTLNFVGSGVTVTDAGGGQANITIPGVTTGNLTDVGTDGITITGGTNAVIGSGTAIAQQVADATHNGYLSSADWNTFNSKGSGTVTAVSVATANGLAGNSSGGATPALTLSTTVTGIVQGDGTTLSAATTTGSGSVVLATAPTLSNPVVGTQAQGDSSTKAASTAYVDTAVSNNSIAKQGCVYATVAALPANTYNNGASGVGATLTGVAFGALSVDGNVVVAGQRILVKNEVTQANNGIYTVTTVGAVATLYVLTRATDYNLSSEIVNGTTTFIDSGSTLASTTWAMNNPAVITVGTTAITFVQTAGPGSVTAGTGLTLTGSSLSVNNSQNIATLSNLSSNGLVTTSGGTGALSVTATTGSGNAVLATSPTITTPTIAKLANLTTNGIAYTTGSDGTLNSGPLTGDVTSSALVTTLATVNSDVGSFTGANITVDAKGRITAAANGSGGSGFTSTDDAAFTPTIDGMSTITVHNMYWRREGGYMVIMGQCTAVSPAGSALALTIPDSQSIDTTRATALKTRFGEAQGLFTSTTWSGAGFTQSAFYDGTTATKVYFGYSAGGGTGYLKGNANDITTNGNFINFSLRIPISGWTNNN